MIVWTAVSCASNLLVVMPGLYLEQRLHVWRRSPVSLEEQKSASQERKDCVLQMIDCVGQERRASATQQRTWPVFA